MPVFLGISEPEVNVFQFALDIVQAKLMCQRYIQHKSLKNLPLFRQLREHLEIPHHLESVGNLEHRDPRVCGVLDNQFLVVLGFKTCVLRLYGRNLVQAVHHLVNF